MMEKQESGKVMIGFKDLVKREVISLETGAKIGYVDDVRLDVNTAAIDSLVVFGVKRLFGLLGESEDVIIPWSELEMIGEDALLVRHIRYKAHDKPRRRFLDWLKIRFARQPAAVKKDGWQ